MQTYLRERAHDLKNEPYVVTSEYSGARVIMEQANKFIEGKMKLSVPVIQIMLFAVRKLEDTYDEEVIEYKDKKIDKGNVQK